MRYLIAILKAAYKEDHKVTVTLITGGRVTWYVTLLDLAGFQVMVGSSWIRFDDITEVVVHGPASVKVARRKAA